MAAKVRKKDVDRAAAAYQSAMGLYGPANYETDRRLGDWRTLQAAYEKQTGRPMYRMNPRGRTVLASQVDAIEYRHAWDGLPYRHDFDKKGTRAYLTGDGRVEISNAGLPLWEEYRGQPFLVNSPGEGRKMARRKAARKGNRTTARRKVKRSPPKGFRTWKAYMASIRPGGTSTRKRRRRRNPSEGVAVARHSNPRKRGRGRRGRSVARYARGRRRRNPPGRRIVGQVIDGVQGGLAVTGGRIAARAIPVAVGLPVAGFAGIATQIGAGFAASMAVDKLVSRKLAPYVLAGAISAVAESLLKKANVPMISAALGDEGDLLAAYPLSLGLQAYPDMGAYPAYSRLGDIYVE